MTIVVPALRSATNPATWAKNELWRKAVATPSLDLRFAESQSLVDATTGSNLVDFTRASSGTYVGSDGLIKTATTNAPRFDHDPTTGESLGLLVEESRTNLIPGSENVDYGGYAQKEITTSLNVATEAAPNGTTTADKIAPTAITDEHFIGYPVNATSGTTYTFSAYVKPNGADSVRIRFASTAFSNENGSHVFSTNTTTSGDCDFKITPVANGWYRIQGTAVASSTGQGIPRIYPNSINSWLGVPSEALYVWGAQLEAGSFPTSYIPTTTATVTRAADVASISGSNFSSWYRQDEGTVFYEGQVLGSDPLTNKDMLGLSDGTANEIAYMFIPSGSNQRFKMTKDGALQALQNAVPTEDVYSPVKSTYAFKLDDSTSGSNGTILSADTSCSIPTVDRFTFGSQTTGVAELAARYKRLTYWPQRLPDSTLQTITQ